MRRLSDLFYRFRGEWALLFAGLLLFLPRRLDATPAAFVHNQLISNWVAVMAYGGTSFDIADNLFEGNESCGLYLSDTGTSRIIGNRFENSGKSSVTAEGTVENSIWTGNITDLPPDFTKVEDGFARMENP